MESAWVRIASSVRDLAGESSTKTRTVEAMRTQALSRGESMEFMTFPIRVDRDGWLSRSTDRSAGLMQVLGVIAATERGGWRGSEQFGAQEILLEMQRSEGVRLVAIKQMNQALEDLGIDWVRVSDIEHEPSQVPGVFNYLFTLSYSGKSGKEDVVQRLEILSDG
jgi:hypothetical protein